MAKRHHEKESSSASELNTYKNMSIFLIVFLLIPFLKVLELKYHVMHSILNIQKVDQQTADTAESICKIYLKILDLNQEIYRERSRCRFYLSNPETATLIPSIATSLQIKAQIQGTYIFQIGVKLRRYHKDESVLNAFEPERLFRDSCGFPGPLVWSKRPVAQATLRVHLPDQLINSGFLVEFESLMNPKRCYWKFHNPKVI